MFDALIDIPAETTKKLVSCGRKFARELGCNVHEIQISIVYNEQGHPNYWLYRLVDNGTRWELVREVKIKEIV